MIELSLFIQLIVWLAIAFFFFRSRSASFFHPLTFYLLFHGLVFVLRPFLVYYLVFHNEYYEMGFFPDANQFSLALFVSSVALAVFALASWTSGYAIPRFGHYAIGEFSIAQRRAFWITLGLLGPWGLYSAVIASPGFSFEGVGAVQMHHDPYTGIAVFSNTTGYVALAHGMLGSIAVLFVVMNRFTLWSFVPLVAFIGYRAYIGWGRWAIVLTLLVLALLHLYHTRKQWFRARYIVLAIPVFVLFQNLGWDRNFVRWLVDEERIYAVDPEYETRSWLEKQDTADFASFDYLAYVVSVVPDRSLTYTYFSQYLQLFTEPIPRILWPEKPVGPPIRLVNLNEYGRFAPRVVSLAGDGWMSLGWVGVIITMGAVGFILGRLHRWFWRNQARTYTVIIYCTILPYSLQWFRDGGISIAKFMLWALFPILVWAVIARFIEATSHKRAERSHRRQI